MPWRRPHAALDMQVPASRYTRSSRPYRGLEELTYPFHDLTVTVTHCGRICFQGRIGAPRATTLAKCDKERRANHARQC